tara:strand:+ start:297 stop:1442 length:1146 start_codon:yes stop_codon:yes gene_type:complete
MEVFTPQFECATDNLRERCFEKCQYFLGDDDVARLMNPEMLELFAKYSTDSRKQILMFIGSAEKLWGMYSEDYLRAYLAKVVAKWGEEHLMVVVGGNDGTGTTYVVTNILAELYPEVRLISIIPVVNKETRRAVCGMGVSTYEQDAPGRVAVVARVDDYGRPTPDGLKKDKIRAAKTALAEMKKLPIGIVGLLRDARSSLTDYVRQVDLEHPPLEQIARTLIPTQDEPVVFQEPLPDGNSYWKHSFVTSGGGELLTDPEQGYWDNHTVWPIADGGGPVRQQVMAWLVNFFKGQCAVLEGGGGTLNEIQAFSAKTQANPSPTTSILINSTFLLSLMQKKINALTAKTEEQGELLLDLAGKLEMEGGALAPELSRQIVELTQP